MTTREALADYEREVMAALGNAEPNEAAIAEAWAELVQAAGGEEAARAAVEAARKMRPGTEAVADDDDGDYEPCWTDSYLSELWA